MSDDKLAAQIYDSAKSALPHSAVAIAKPVRVFISWRDNNVATRVDVASLKSLATAPLPNEYREQSHLFRFDIHKHQRLAR